MIAFGLTLLALQTLLGAPQGATDPEQGPDGRSHFLGRAVAQTMHWTGAPWLLRATREDEENGALLRRWLAVRQGQVVCDLGCGNGYHALPLADAVGRTGKVFAVDVQQQMLDLLRLRAKGKDIDNLVLVTATVDDPKLPKASCDLVLLVDVYHELSHPVRVMGHVRDALKPGGRVVLVEFRAEDPEVPIKPEHTMSKAQVVREMAEHGFELTADFDGLPWQHAMSFTPAIATGPRFQAQQVLRGYLATHGDPRWLGPYRTSAVPAGALDDAVWIAASLTDLRIELRAGPNDSLLASLRARRAPLRQGLEVAMTKDRDGRWAVEGVQRPTAFVHAHGAKRPFVAMHTGTGNGPVAEQVALVHELGFDGLEWGLDQLPELRSACEARGLDVFAAYGVLDVAKATGAELQPLRAALRALAGGPGMLWLALHYTGKAPRDAAGDAAAIEALTSLLTDATATGVEIALYPHHGHWLETTDDALRLCTRLRHPRLGVCFNLCHFLRTSESVDPGPLLARCGARLFAVTINGAAAAGSDWSTLIQPLGEGDVDLRRLLAALDAVGFAGPVGLQAFGIASPPREHLTKSMTAWRAAHGR